MQTYAIKSCLECPFRTDTSCCFNPEFDPELISDEDISLSCPLNEGILFIAANSVDDADLPDDDDDKSENQENLQ
jgi:hypothetical protein